MSESPLRVLRVATGHSLLFQNGARTKLASRLECPIAVYGLDPVHAPLNRLLPLSPTFIRRREPKDHL